jgi:hypothetical protein
VLMVARLSVRLTGVQISARLIAGSVQSTR